MPPRIPTRPCVPMSMSSIPCVSTWSWAVSIRSRARTWSSASNAGDRSTARSQLRPPMSRSTFAPLTGERTPSSSTWSETGQGRPLPRIVEYHLHRLTDPHSVRIAVDNVCHHPRTLLQLHVGKHVHARLAVRGEVRLATAVDGEAVNTAAARCGDPIDPRRSAVGTERPRIPDECVTLLALR